MKKKILAELLQAHLNYMARVRSSGARILAYATPCCSKTLETTAPKNGETWDSLTTCPHCGQMYMKVCRRDGVTATVLPATKKPRSRWIMERAR